ncbi:hypothetical protein AAVH_32200, partial [Aphelenchoides avenae]
IVKARKKLGHRIHLRSDYYVEDDFAKEIAALKKEVTKLYKPRETDTRRNKEYAARPLDGIEVIWRFHDNHVSCTVQPA